MIISVAGFAVYTETGVLQKAFGQLLKNNKSKKSLVLMILVMAFFYLRGGLTGAIDSPIAFIPIIIGLAISMGYDAMTGFAMAAMTAFVGFSIGPTNPYTTGIAQTIAELPLYSGIEYRTVVWLLFMVVTMVYIIIYAEKVKKDPTVSLSSEVDVTEFELKESQIEGKLNSKDKILLVAFVAQLSFTIFSTVVLKFSIPKLAAVYIIATIIAGILAGYNDKKIASVFINAGKKVMFGIFCVAIARSIPIILTNGNIIDTIIYYTANSLKSFPPAVGAIGMLIVQTIINFFINSGSGQAAATMPIMTPLADLIGVSRQVAVLAFQFGDGLSNMVFPTSGNLLAFLAVGKINYRKFLKLAIPLFIILNILAAIALVVATMIGY